MALRPPENLTTYFDSLQLLYPRTFFRPIIELTNISEFSCLFSVADSIFLWFEMNRNYFNSISIRFYVGKSDIHSICFSMPIYIGTVYNHSTQYILIYGAQLNLWHDTDAFSELSHKDQIGEPEPKWLTQALLK